MGIGGLDTEFSAIFRRAFASRIFPPGLVEKLGIQHVKGLFLISFFTVPSSRFYLLMLSICIASTRYFIIWTTWNG